MSTEDINARRVSDLLNAGFGTATLPLERGPDGKTNAALQEVLDKLATPDCAMAIQELLPEEEAAARLAGTFDPNQVIVTMKYRLKTPVDFITLEFIEPDGDGRITEITNISTGPIL